MASNWVRENASSGGPRAGTVEWERPSERLKTEAFRDILHLGAFLELADAMMLYHHANISPLQSAKADHLPRGFAARVTGGPPGQPVVPGRTDLAAASGAIPYRLPQ